MADPGEVASIGLTEIEAYFSWLRERTRLRSIDETWSEITTPFLNRHNDYIQLYVRRSGENLEITDAGETVADLELSGMEVHGKRRSLMLDAVRGFGVEAKGNEIVSLADRKSFPLKMHSVIQAVLAVDDLFYLSRERVVSVFLEEVEEWLINRDIRYSPRIKLNGRSGYDHTFDFLIPRSKISPERIVGVINKANRQNASNFLFSWTDTSALRPEGARAYAIVNDRLEGSALAEFTEAVEKYDVQTIAWSRRENFVRELAN